MEMQTNILVVALAALIPMVIGFIWYHPKVFGNAWMNATGLTEESIKGANMAVIFGISLVFAFMIAFSLQMTIIHQNNVHSLVMNEPGYGQEGSEVSEFLKSTMDKYGHNFRTFRHGVAHGVFLTLLLILPVMGTNALFERKGFKYIAINVGYWLVSLSLMGGVICQFV